MDTKRYQEIEAKIQGLPEIAEILDKLLLSLGEAVKTLITTELDEGIEWLIAYIDSHLKALKEEARAGR